MSIEVYRAYLKEIDLTDAQKDQLIDLLFAISENIIQDLFKHSDECVK